MWLVWTELWPFYFLILNSYGQPKKLLQLQQCDKTSLFNDGFLVKLLIKVNYVGATSQMALID